MPEPSLSELYSYRPNADLAQGDRDVVPDNRQAIQDAIGLAQENNHAIQQRYALFQKNYADRLKAGQVDYTGVNPNHISELKQKAANVFSILYKNPSALAGINIDPKTEAEFAAAKDDLERSVAASKTQYDYAKAQDAFMNHTPELITDENKKVTQSNYTAPLGQFSPKSLQLPAVVDYNALAKGALDVSKKEKAIFEPEYVPKRNETGGLIPKVTNGKIETDAQGRPVYEQEYAGRFRSGISKEADFDSYMKNAMSTYDSNQPLGKFDQPIQQSVASSYKGLPEPQKMAIEEAAKEKGISPEKYFYSKIMASKFDKMTDLSGVKEVEDNLFKMKADQRNDLEKMKTKFGYDVYLKDLENKNAKDLELWRDKNGLRDIDKGGEALNDIVAGPISQAISAGHANEMAIKRANGTVEYGWYKIPIPKQTLDFFSTKTPLVDKKGKPVMTSGGKQEIETTSPVEMLVNASTTQVKPLFATEGNDQTGRQITSNDNSQPMTIDQYKQGMAKGLGLEKSLDASTRMLQRIPGLKFPTLDGNIDTYIKNRAAGNYNPDKGGGGKMGAARQSNSGPAGVKEPTDIFTKDELKGAGWTDAQIQEAVSKNKIKIK